MNTLRGPRTIVAACLLNLLALTGCDRSGPLDTDSGITSLSGETGRRYLDDLQVDTTLGSNSSTEDVWWKDVTDCSGVRFAYHNGREGGQYTILESVGGGTALLDFDQDGDLDLLFPGGGAISLTMPLTVTGIPCALFQNDGNGQFSEVSGRIDAPDWSLYSHGAFVSDFDRDGFPDALITGFHGCVLLRNERGEGFSDVTSVAGLQMQDWTTGAAWADFNRDGWPDLFLLSYVEWNAEPDSLCGDQRHRVRDVCPPQKYPEARQQLFLNNRDGSFSVVERAFEGTGRGKGLGCVALDLNGDQWIDIYVANDQVANQLYLGGPEFPLKNVGGISATSGNEIGVPEGSMGVDAADYDGDGLPDLWVTNFELEDNSLYHNDGGDLFCHSTIQMGLGGVSRPHVGFGTGFADFDLDGWLDLYVINGHVLYETGRSAYLQSPFLLRNVSVAASRRYRNVSNQHGGDWFQGRYAGRGSAVGDLDNDGDLDLVVVRQNELACVLMNQLQPDNWFRLDLRGTVSEPNAVGAVVSYRFNERTIVRHVRAGAGYLSQSDQRILLPAGTSTDLEVKVQWLTGRTERFQNLQPRSTNLILEGNGEPL